MIRDDPAAASPSADPAPRVALVTGAKGRVGSSLCEKLIDDGWIVAQHRRRADDPLHPRAIGLSGDLGDPATPEALVRAAADHGPLRLLVNNAALFERDQIGAIDPALFDRAMRINLLAPALLSEAMAAHGPGEGDALIVNIGDAKLAAPNPDYLSYTLSKQGLAGLTELTARTLAGRGIRVNMIAPALMLRSGEQSEADFARVHALNPLQRGVTPDAVWQALRFLIASPTVTGQCITVDGGQRFWQLARDVAFVQG